MKKLLVTGGLGFIGSYFTDLALKRGYHVVNLDKKTYAARKDVFFVHPEYEFIEGDICTITHLPPNIDYIVNFAAESHVDNSIVANGVFFESNIRGVYNLLELINAKDPGDRPVLVHISTDEVYGTMHGGAAKETDVLRPSSPYAATKAAADQLIHAWKETYGIRSIICRSCNNYGYGQYPEKLFAKTVEHLFNNKPMTVHGNGSYKREWMYAGDNCEAILSVLERGTIGEIYNISSNEEHSVIDVVRMIAETMKPGDDWTKWVDFIPNRWGQDIRYSIDCEKIHRLGWSPKTRLQNYIPVYLEEYRKHHAQDASPSPLSIGSR